MLFVSGKSISGYSMKNIVRGAVAMPIYMLIVTAVCVSTPLFTLDYLIRKSKSKFQP